MNSISTDLSKIRVINTINQLTERFTVFLEKLIVTQQVRKLPAFKVHERSLLSTHKLTTGPYREPVNSSQHPTTIFPKGPF
jgi:hypothetical protein